MTDAKRDSRLTADITKDAHNMLRALVKKHERGKGYFIDRMIRKFCAETPVKEDEKVKPKKNPVKKFKPPTVEEVFEYCNERCNNIDAQSFVSHYTTTGWMRGSNKIKDWKACIHTWERNEKNNKTEAKAKTDNNFNVMSEWINE